MKKLSKILLILMNALFITPIVWAARDTTFPGAGGTGTAGAFSRIITLITEAGFLLILGFIFFWVLMYALIKHGLEKANMTGKPANLIAVALAFLFSIAIIYPIGRIGTSPEKILEGLFFIGGEFTYLGWFVGIIFGMIGAASFYWIGSAWEEA